MKKSIIVIIAVLSCLVLSAQSKNQILESFLQSAQTGRLWVKFSFKADIDKLPVSAEGSFIIQRDSFVMDCGESKVYCDGKSVWTVDMEAKEIIIEDFNLDLKGLMSSAVDVKTENGKLKSLRCKGNDGSFFDLAIPSYEVLPAGDMEDLKFDEKKVGKDFIITDLR